MARQLYKNAPSLTSLMRGKIQRPDYTITSPGAFGGEGADLYLKAQVLDDVLHGLRASRDQGDLSPEGEWLLQDLESQAIFSAPRTGKEKGKPYGTVCRARHARIHGHYAETGTPFGLPKIKVKTPERS